MGDERVPRLAHIVRWPDFNGYGFNLHAEKGKAGQFIGKVDAGSPAEAAGLRPGDRIVEVNGTNIGNENHQQVVGRVKAGGDETTLLVVDPETDEAYKAKKKIVRGDLPEVLRLSAAREDVAVDVPEPEPVPEAVIASVAAVTVNGDAPSPASTEDDRYRPRLCKLCKWHDFDGYGFNLHAEQDKPGQYIGVVDVNSPASTGGMKENDRIVEVNGENVEQQTHSVVIGRIKAGGDKTELLVVDRETDMFYKGQGTTVSSSMSCVHVFVTPATSSEAVTATVTETVERTPEPEPPVQNGTTEEEVAPTETQAEEAVAEAVATVAVESAVVEAAAVEPTDEVVEEVTVAETETVVESQPDTNTYEEVEVRAAAPIASEPEPEPETGAPANGINGGTEVAAPAAVVSEPEPEPAVIKSVSTAPADNSGLKLHLSAAEMKEMLKSKKRRDPRNDKSSFEAKYRMFEKM